MHNFINAKLANSLKLPTKNVCSTHIDDEDVQVFKDFKITMGNYVLHYDFQSQNMDNMDIVLGYPWMKSVGTINFNVENKFLKLWYKKKKANLWDISLSPLASSKVEHDAVSTGTLEVIPIDTSYDESMVVDTTDDTTT